MAEDVNNLHQQLIDALCALAASMIKRGADPAAVQRYVDGQLDRIEARKMRRE